MFFFLEPVLFGLSLWPVLQNTQMERDSLLLIKMRNGDSKFCRSLLASIISDLKNLCFCFFNQRNTSVWLEVNINGYWFVLLSACNSSYLNERNKKYINEQANMVLHGSYFKGGYMVVVHLAFIGQTIDNTCIWCNNFSSFVLPYINFYEFVRSL